MTFPRAAGGAYQRAAGRYNDDAVSTASPARLLVLLYDRLVLDLARARHAQLDGDRETASDNLMHAQDIVAELLSSLDVDAWDGGPRLAGIYTWMISELVRANVSKDPVRTADCLELADSLRQAWTEAEAETSAGGTGSPGGMPLVGLTG